MSFRVTRVCKRLKAGCTAFRWAPMGQNASDIFWVAPNARCLTFKATSFQHPSSRYQPKKTGGDRQMYRRPPRRHAGADDGRGGRCTAHHTHSPLCDERVRAGKIEQRHTHAGDPNQCLRLCFMARPIAGGLAGGATSTSTRALAKKRYFTTEKPPKCTT